MKYSLIAVLAISLPAFGAGWSGANHVGANAAGASGSSRAVTITATTGTMIAADATCAANSGAAPTVTSVTDDKSNSYVLLVTRNDATQHQDTEIWVAIGATTGVTTVTINFSASCTAFLDGYARDFTVPTSSTIAIDPETACGATVSGNGCMAEGSSSSATAGTITLAGTNDLVLSLTASPSSSAVNNSYTLDSTADGNGVAHLSNFAGGSTSVTFTTTSGVWEAVIGAVKATSSTAHTAPFVIY